MFVGDKVTVYGIAVGEGSRSYKVAAAILGEDFDGTLCRDDWASCCLFKKATHQMCLAHLLRRSNEMIADSVAGQAASPMRCAARSQTPSPSGRGATRDTTPTGGAALEAEIAALAARADKLLAAKVTHEPNRRLLGHLRKECVAVFRFLRSEGVPATNHEAERAIRPQLCTRKNWGGNKSAQAAQASKVIGSVIRTAGQQALDPVEGARQDRHQRRGSLRAGHGRRSRAVRP